MVLWCSLRQGLKAWLIYTIIHRNDPHHIDESTTAYSVAFLNVKISPVHLMKFTEAAVKNVTVT